jgi:hypothetical protein
MEGIRMSKKNYYISFKNEFGQWEDQTFETDDLRKATFEARELQRILDKDKKEIGACYCVRDKTGTIIFQANGY